MPDQPLALGFDVKNLAVDFSQPSDMTLRRGFACAPMYIKPSGQTIQLHQFPSD